jgi:hypothetical protein
MPASPPPNASRAHLRRIAPPVPWPHDYVSLEPLHFVARRNDSWSGPGRPWSGLISVKSTGVAQAARLAEPRAVSAFHRGLALAAKTAGRRAATTGWLVAPCNPSESARQHHQRNSASESERISRKAETTLRPPDLVEFRMTQECTPAADRCPGRRFPCVKPRLKCPLF